MNKTTAFYLKQLTPLVGGTVTGFFVDDSSDDPFEEEYYGLKITLPNGKQKVLFFLSDDEGNGPGSFDIADFEP